MTEPRRLAVRAAARRMASVRGEAVGGVVGYAVRGEQQRSDATRIEVVTEGLLVRRLQQDPALDGVAAVVLDEFHERSLDLDLALALVADVRASLRPDLRVVVMSATIDPGPVADLLGRGAAEPTPVIRIDVPVHPVQTRYRPGSAHDRLEDRVADVVVEATRADPGDVLVFLPGRPEIRRTVAALRRRAGAGGRHGAGAPRLPGPRRTGPGPVARPDRSAPGRAVHQHRRDVADGAGSAGGGGRRPSPHRGCRSGDGAAGPGHGPGVPGRGRPAPGPGRSDRARGLLPPVVTGGRAPPPCGRPARDRRRRPGRAGAAGAVLGCGVARRPGLAGAPRRRAATRRGAAAGRPGRGRRGRPADRPGPLHGRARLPPEARRRGRRRRGRACRRRGRG